MKKLSKKISDLHELIAEKKIKTVSFDIDGTLYPIIKVQMRWWLMLLRQPIKAIKFLSIKKKWEQRRLGNQNISIVDSDILFFEHFLLSLLQVPNLVPSEIRSLLMTLQSSGIKVYFLSDHGATSKIKALELLTAGHPINCLTETGELKPHSKISVLLSQKYGLVPEKHLHLGDRWSDQEQAKLFGCHFVLFKQ